MRDLNDLKARVIAMIVMVLSITFVEVVVDSPSGQQVLDLGGGIAAVVVALTLFLRLGRRTQPLTAGRSFTRANKSAQGCTIGAQGETVARRSENFPFKSAAIRSLSDCEAP